MKIFPLVFVSAMILAPLTGCAGNNHHIIDVPTKTSAINGWSVENHIAAAKEQEQKAQMVIAKVEKMVEQISELNKKPYLDPKSLRRDSLTRISRNLVGELRSIQIQIAWHHKEAKVLTAMSEKSQSSS